MFDIVVSATAILLLSPLLIALAILVRVFLGSPVLFRQERSGKNQKAFTILKFRTMTDETDASGTHLPDTMRLTRLGRFLRATSLDELPELFNVLMGSMTLVGPRPLISRYDPWFKGDELRRFEAMPGITGWAQVNGRNALSWEDRFQLDVWYVDHCSLWLDIKILLLTVVKVVRRENVHVNTDLTVISLDDERRAKLAKAEIRTPTPANESPLVTQGSIPNYQGAP